MKQLLIFLFLIPLAAQAQNKLRIGSTAYNNKRDKSDTTAQSGTVTHYQDDTAKLNLRAADALLFASSRIIFGSTTIAASATSVTVTNASATISSRIIPIISTNDANVISLKSLVKSTGSFVVNLTAAPAASVTIDYLIIN